MFVQDLGNFFGGNQYIYCGSYDFTIRHYAADVSGCALHHCFAVPVPAFLFSIAYFVGAL